MSTINPEDLNDILDQCNEGIIDETSPDQLPQLKTKIEELARLGIDAHVVVVESIADEGFADAPSYVDEIVKTCGWSTPDDVTLFVSLDPRKYDIYAQDGGRVSNVLEVGNNDKDLQEVFKAQLKDPNSSWQADASVTLSELYKLIDVADQSTDAPVSHTEQPSNESGVDIPILPITSGLGIVGVIGVLGYFAKNRQKFTAELKKRSEIITRVVSNGILKADEADQLLRLVADNDFPDLRKEVASLQRVSLSADSGFREQKAKILQLPRRTRRPHQVSDAFNAENEDGVSVNDAVDATIVHTASVNELLLMAQERMSGIDKYQQELNELFSGLELAYETLESLGYATSSLKEEDQELNAKKREILALREKRYIDKPYGLIVELSNNIRAKLAEYNKIPAWHEDLQGQKEKLLLENQSTHDIATKAEEARRQLLANFNPECFSDMSDAHQQLENILQRLTTMERSITDADLGSKDIATLKDTEREMFVLSDTQRDVGRISAQIIERKSLLVTLQQTLPNEYNKVTTIHSDLIDFWNNSKANVSPKHEKTLLSIKALLEDSLYELQQQKPHYTKLAESKKELIDNMKQCRNILEEEKEETIRMRHWLESRPDELIESGKGLATEYLEHSDVTDGTKKKLRSLRVPSKRNVSTLDYTGVHGQYLAWQAYQETISNMEARASQEIAYAEHARQEERERIQEEERRREESERSSHSSSGFDFGGSSDFSSHSSGGFDFGGSSDSSSHSSGDF